MSNNYPTHDEAGKSYKELYEAAESRRNLQRRVFRAMWWAWLAVMFTIGITYAYLNYRFQSHHLIGGIAPRYNVESTDYTLLGYNSPSGGRNIREYKEWVVRLPKDAIVYGVKDSGDVKVNLGAGWMTFRHQNNNYVAWNVSFDTLKYFNIERQTRSEDGYPDQNLVSIRLRGENSYDKFSSDYRKLLEAHCQSTGKIIGELQEYVLKSDEKMGLDCKDVGYVWWSSQNIDMPHAIIRCRASISESDKKPRFCDFETAFRGKKIHGEYPIKRLSEAKVFFDRLEKKLGEITVADRVLGELPFVLSATPQL